MAEHNDLGNKGEELALAFLRGIGYRVLETNWRFLKDEIDIVAMDGPFLVIVEVKTRSSNHFGEPEVFVNRVKQKALIRCANRFIIQKDFRGETRFDILSVIITPTGHHVAHIKNAFYPTL
jgi:putative endonuclease